MNDALIEIEHVVKVYRRESLEIPVLTDVNLKVPEGEFVALMGPSGSGKTTLLNLIAGIDQPTRGRIVIGGRDISQISQTELARWRSHNIGFIFQLYNLLPVLTAFENVELPLLLTNLKKAERRKHVETALGIVGLSDRMDHYPRQLSGGQEQRVAIARAIVSDPTILVADEPTGDLDAKSADEILDAPEPFERRVQEDDRHGDPRSEGRRAGPSDGASGQGGPPFRRADRDRNDEDPMKYFSLIWKNVFRKRLRTGLTMSSILLVLILIVILTSLLQAMQADPSGGKGANRLVVQHATGLGNFLPLSQRQRIEQIPGVVAVSPEVWFGGVYKDDRPENWIGQLVDRSRDLLRQDLRRRDDRPEGQRRVESHSERVRGGREDRRQVPLEEGRPHHPEGYVHPVRTPISSTSDPLNAGDESNLFFHNEYLNQSSWFGANKYTGLYYLKVDNGENVPRVAAAIDKMFENSDAPTKTLTEKQFQLQFMEMMGNVKFLINGISLIILFAVTLIVANTIAMSARERVTEIAVMRTLGFGRGHILGFILSESVVMSLLGGLLGVLAGEVLLRPRARRRPATRRPSRSG